MTEFTKEVKTETKDTVARRSHVEVREMGAPAPGTERDGQ